MALYFWHSHLFEIRIRQEKGNIWLSGGLANCAEQIHLDNGDTLIVDIEDIMSFASGDRVSVKYKELDLNQTFLM